MSKKNTPRIPAEYIALRLKPTPQWFTAEMRDRRSAELAGMLAKFKPAIQGAFNEVNGKASSFTLDASDAIAEACETETDMAARGITKANRAGATVTVTSAGPSANSYKYQSIGTFFRITRTPTGHWDIIDITRTAVFPKQRRRRTATVSHAAIANIVAASGYEAA